MKPSLFIRAFFALLFLASPLFASAGVSDDMSGYAWSSNIGWISFNCTDTNTCGIVDYGVDIASDGTLTGYAWSSNIGWIKFGGLSGFPTGQGTQAINAKINGSNLQGWARAIAQDGNGWDGWIALSGAGPSYGVNLSGTNFTGYAWGSSVVGWISFDIAGANGVKRTADPATFSLGGTEAARIQFLGPGSADSEEKAIFVSTAGGFSAPVSISITGFPTPPASTTFTYSLGGSAFSSNPAPVVISSPYASGTTIKVRVSKAISTSYTLTLTGSSSGYPSATKDIVITPTTFDPVFIEF
jgi:hypothetical protein